MTETFDNKLIEDIVVKLHKFAATQLPKDVSDALKTMYDQFSSSNQGSSIET